MKCIKRHFHKKLEILSKPAWNEEDPGSPDSPGPAPPMDDPLKWRPPVGYIWEAERFRRMEMRGSGSALTALNPML